MSDGLDSVRDADVIPLPSRYNPTDVGNAERFIAEHGSDVCHTRGHGWLEWDGTRWLEDETGAATRRMVSTIRAMYRKAATTENDEERKRLIAHAFASEKEPRIRGALKLAETFEAIAVRDEDLDARQGVVNVENGTLDLKDLTLRKHQRGDLLTKRCPVPYNPKAKCPRWLAFLERVTDGRADLIEGLQRAVGYSLTGNPVEQVAFFLHGRGKNGKSTFVETIRALFGDYAQQTPAETFLERRGGNTNDVARLRGARLVTAVEMPAGKRMDETLVKRITGGDTISTRFLYAEYFEFTPAFVVWVATNHRPEVRGTDEAIWRRIHLVPFDVQIPERERDLHLKDELRDELPGILAWAVEGLEAYQADGLGTPTAVSEATASYRAEQDVLGSFIEEKCVISEGAQVKASELYKAYVDYTAASGERDPMPLKTFGAEIRATKGLPESKRTKCGVFYRGIGLVTDDPSLLGGGEG